MQLLPFFVPHDSSIKALCIDFFLKVDNLKGEYLIYLIKSSYSYLLFVILIMIKNTSFIKELDI